MSVEASLHSVEQAYGSAWLLAHDVVHQLGVEGQLESAESLLDLVEVIDLGFFVRSEIGNKWVKV